LKDVGGSIADTTRRAGESIKETAISAKDAVADTSRRAVDVGERVKDSVFPRKGTYNKCGTLTFGRCH
jgi:hypothetical protein